MATKNLHIIPFEWRDGIKYLHTTPVDVKIKGEIKPQTSNFALVLLEYLRSRKDGQGNSWAGLDTMSDDLGLSKNTLRHARDVLMKLRMVYNVPFNERTPYQKTLHPQLWVYHLTGVCIPPTVDELYTFFQMDSEATLNTVNDLHLRGMVSKSELLRVQSLIHGRVQSLNPKNESSFEELTNEEMATSEPVEIISMIEVEQIERSNPNWMWMKISPSLMLGEPYKTDDTTYTRRPRGQIVTATRYNETWVLMNPHTFLAYHTTRKGSETLTEPTSTDYSRIRNAWNSRSSVLDNLDVSILYRVWKKATGGEPANYKFFPVSPPKILKLYSDLGGK